MDLEQTEVAAALPSVALSPGKAEGRGKGGAAATADTKWEPFEGWDMRPIAAAAAAAATTTTTVDYGSGDGAASEAEEEREEGEGDKKDEKSTKDVIIDLEKQFKSNQMTKKKHLNQQRTLSYTNTPLR